MNLDKKTFVIGILSLSAVILTAANLMMPRGAVGATAVYDKDSYQMQTGRINGGAEAVYVTDNRTGMMAAFVYNPNRRMIEPAGTPKQVMDAFAGAGANTGQPARRGYGR